MISRKVYEQLNPDSRPYLRRSSNLVSANGTPIKEMGKGVFEISLGPVKLQKEIIVAEIEDDGLLGMDILQNDASGPADILMSKGVIKLRGHEVPCISTSIKDKNRKVTVADDFIIPGLSEAIIDVYIERKEADELNSINEFIIEPSENFREAYPLHMAATLVDNKMNVTNKVRLLNPFPTTVSLQQNAVVGTAEPVPVQPITLVPQENPEAETDNASIRRIQLQQNIEGCRDTLRNNMKEEASEPVPNHLKDLLQRTTRKLEVKERNAVTDLLIQYKDIFSKGEWDIGCTQLTEHSIETGNAKPIKQPPRRVPLAYAGEEKRAVEKLLEQNVARKSTSPWASPIVLVKKKNGSIRPCIDYRRLNSLVTPDAFPLPRIQDCLDAVSGSTLFSTFDLTSGYFQIPVKAEDIPKTAFACKFGHFEMTRMPFGLNNSASTFQRTMELALQGLQWETCIIYIDDIIVFAKTIEEHLKRVEQVFERLKQAGLKLKPEKCDMLQEEVTFLGHVVAAKGVRPNATNISKIMAWPAPKTPKQVKQFVAMCSYFRRFIKDFALKSRPMVDLTKKGSKFVWSTLCQDSFESLKAALVSPEVMGYPLNEGGEFILDTDASGVAIGSVLIQVQEGREKVIAYASRAMNKAERNYCITEQELLAVRYFLNISGSTC